MSTASKSDQLKTKKLETQGSMANVTDDRKLASKTQTVSRTSKKGSSHLNERKSVSNERKPFDKNKGTNVPYSTPKNAKIGAQKSSQTKKSGPRSVNISSQEKHVSLRAKQTPRATSILETFNSVTGKKPVIRKKNAVLDTPHNVTVTSPTSKRKNGQSNFATNNDYKVDTSKLMRKGSRTLAPDEIVVLKRESAKMRSEEAILKGTVQMADKKEPIAFEVKFDENHKKGRQVCDGEIVAVDGKQQIDEDTIYSDDFESYESDFETGSSKNSFSTSDTLSDENYKVCEKMCANQEESLPQVSSHESEHEDDTEVTQRPTLEFQADKERELDSGNYDTSLCKIHTMKSSDPTSQSSQPDNWETTSLGISEQMDSGISTCAVLRPFSDDKRNFEVVYGGYRYFYEQPIISSRGCELKTKIQFDVLSFILIDLKPISYETFMQAFGKINAQQNFTQTQDNQMNAEQQTEIYGTRSFWTQHPPQFVVEISKNYDENRISNQLSCGEDIQNSKDQPSYCELEQNLNAIKKLRSQRSKRQYLNCQNRQKRLINYQQLHSFMLRSSFLIGQVLGSPETSTKINPISNLAHVNDQILKRVCERSFYMQTNFLNTLRVIKIFSSSKFNLLITVHESLPDTNVYSSDFSNLLMVWCTNTCDKPMRLLTTWSEVSKVEIPNDSSDIVVAALRDGSIALWDLRETHSFCSQLDGYLTHFAATQSIVPSYAAEKSSNQLKFDIGACLDVKSFKSTAGNILLQTTFPKTQLVSLHESGIVTVWTLVQNSEITFNLMQAEQSEKLKYSAKFTQMFDSISPWARVKLMQSSTVSIKEYLETKTAHSRFEKTKDFFQKNIYSDESLRELNGSTPEVGRQGIRFTSLECGSESIFVCTNRNFVLMCSKTLKMDKLKRIFIDDGQFLFPTALKLLHNERFLAVGLCNGVVMIINCQSEKVTRSSTELMEKSEFSKSFNTDKETILNNPLTSKSCAIQNILLNVQKTCEQIESTGDYRPSTAACMTLIESNRKPFELKVIDQQVILTGSSLRKNLIQYLELSSDGWYLFALANGHVRMYDFYLEQEFPSQESPDPGRIVHLATGKCGDKENTLMILRLNTDLEVIILKQ